MPFGQRVLVLTKRHMGSGKEIGARLETHNSVWSMVNEIRAFQGKIEKRGMRPCDRRFTPRCGRVSGDDDDYYIITMSVKEASKGEIKMTTKAYLPLSFVFLGQTKQTSEDASGHVKERASDKQKIWARWGGAE